MGRRTWQRFILNLTVTALIVAVLWAVAFHQKEGEETLLSKLWDKLNGQTPDKQSDRKDDRGSSVSLIDQSKKNAAALQKKSEENYRRALEAVEKESDPQ